jgi:hypothetical protein
VRRTTFGWLVAAVFALFLSACSGSSDSDQPVASTTSSPTTTENPVESSRAQASFDARIKSENEQAKTRTDAIESRVKAAPSLGQKLTIIITEYCKLGGGDKANTVSGVERNMQGLLIPLYETYWMAGAKWNRPLDSAAKQQGMGACPDTYPTYEPPRGPVG